MSIQEIEKAISQLSREDLAVFRAWFAGFDAEAWDRQLEKDEAAGKLDLLIKEGLDDLHDGRTTEL